MICIAQLLWILTGPVDSYTEVFDAGISNGT
jgi:hypothetical protein